jgi:hypothetical protein
VQLSVLIRHNRPYSTASADDDGTSLAFMKHYSGGAGPLTQSTIVQSHQMYRPLTSVLGGNAAANKEDFAPCSGVNGPLCKVMSVPTYPG